MVFVNYALYSTIYTISTIAIVMSCDGVEESGKKIVKTCFLYQEVLEKPWLKQDLILFAKFTKQLAPKFSAAGFFQINQSVLSTLFSAVITYLIIILQFNMTL
ncbi:hypothetical protein NQ314_008650 [Rhamnusium bicolor]|uniref:Uncharacterized protein n=1 Tax=Rhamnusium bicolor TaxID=1586634 RepID=A0AAV8Y6Z7_9CUCU|nr:hypothetical protein NQ314_008650 [Rhamnusium bicolor]